jgi:hypothetical protein
MKFDVFFMKFHTRLQITDFVLVVVLVLVLRPLYNSDFEDEHEDEYEDEKYQIRSSAYARTSFMKLHCQSFFFD